MGTTTGPPARVVVVGEDAANVARALEEHGMSTESVRTADACLERFPTVDAS